MHSPEFQPIIGSQLPSGPVGPPKQSSQAMTGRGIQPITDRTGAAKIVESLGVDAFRMIDSQKSEDIQHLKKQGFFEVFLGVKEVKYFVTHLTQSV